MNLATFWTTPRWHAYEHAIGHPIGQRSELLETGRFKTRVVDLSQPTHVLWAGVRRSYHALINKQMRTYPLIGNESHSFICYGQGSGSMIRTAQRLHMIDAQRRTRSDESWDCMGNWLCDEEALMTLAFHATPFVRTLQPVLALKDESIAGLPIYDCGWIDSAVGYAYFIVDGKWSYYSSAATLIRDVNHVLVWQSMLAMKDRGVRWCELGWQGHAADDKGKAIEFFRRGFGGKDVLLDAELPRDW